ncbi:2-keto-myo-inositol dehydratase [Halanaerobium congolense]|uniref:2-keto-myo-inositol dehydratase n=1 Tax=Halanaerobium congolense TaxID=54121 RepID=A0A4R8GBV8_9FIRM|nr:sugar phosphate isomerase/epimerase [Halanaerobium congolense]TDX42896.1 2-keto-myo-inositol dehydratase [Halanaerobium congolense]
MIKLGYETNTWGGVVGHPAGVTSIKDSYYLANGSTEEALEDIGNLGYKGFEIFDGNLMDFANKQEEFETLLEKNNLEFIGVYSGANFIYPGILDEELYKIEEVVKLASELGGTYLVLGGGAIRSGGVVESDYKALGEGLDKAAEIADKYGMTAVYHPHLGTTCEGPEQLDKVMKNSEIKLCPDTAHLEAGGADPIKVIEKYIDRIVYIHFKDLKDGEFVPLGEGTQDFSKMLKILNDANYEGWITIELDSHEDPKKGAKITKEYLAEELGLE